MPRALSTKLDDIIHTCRGRPAMTMAEFFKELGVTGPALLTLLFSIPFLFFAWVPILMTAFSVIIFIAGMSVAFNKPLWFPRFIRKRKISGDKVAYHLGKWLKFLKKVEKAIHPRGTIYQHSPFLQALNGFFLSLCGVFLFFSFSPIANFLPALGAFLLSLGILEEDLWIIIAAYGVFLIKMLILFVPIFL